MAPKPALVRCNEKYQTLEELTRMVAGGFSNSLLVYGSGGTGKTHTVTSVLNTDGIDFAILRGYASPSAFYNFLYTHREGLVVIDDCDNIFKDATGLNILKAVLETDDVRRVSWETPSRVVIASTFEFTGQIIFLTNYNFTRLSGHMQALLTRVHAFCMNLEVDEVLARMKFMAMTVPYKEVSRNDRLVVYRFLRDAHAEIPHFNLRHYIKALDMLVFNRTGWRKLLRNSIKHS